MIIVQYLNPVNCFGYIGLPSSPAAEAAKLLFQGRSWAQIVAAAFERVATHMKVGYKTMQATFNQHTMKSGINDTQNWMGITPNMFLQLCWVEQTCKYFSFGLFLVFLWLSHFCPLGEKVELPTQQFLLRAFWIAMRRSFLKALRVPLSTAAVAAVDQRRLRTHCHTLGPVGRGQH